MREPKRRLDAGPSSFEVISPLYIEPTDKPDGYEGSECAEKEHGKDQNSECTPNPQGATSRTTSGKFASNQSAPDLPDHQFWWPSHVGIDIERLKQDNRTLAERRIDHKMNCDLCKFCRLFFDTWSNISAYQDSGNKDIETLVSVHWETMAELEDSASEGCHMCAFIIRSWLSTLSRDDKSEPTTQNSGPPPKPEGFIYIALEKKDVDLLSAIFLYFTETEARIRVHALLVPQLQESTSESDAKAFTSFIGLAQTTQQSNECSSLLLPHRWLSQCRETHEACRETQPVTPPTRLIKIDEQVPRLCISAEQGDCSVYATLSHCWGKLKFLRLRKDNTHSLMAAIPSDGLTKTFQDAIEIARRLGFSWLWIDSLCIVQDDADDWRKESSLMTNVYGQSSLNIMASAASDGRTGCLFERDSSFPRGGQVEVEVGGVRRIYDYTDSEIYTKNVQSSPLVSRSWVLQERLLSKRRLFYGTSDIIWECKIVSKSVTYPDELPSIFYRHEHLSKREIWQSWRDILQAYTRTFLTFRSDKLVAIAGIVRNVHEKTGDQYLAGIWASNLHKELCWHVVSAGGTRNYLIPSWSWAATDSRIEMPPELYEVIILTTEVVKVQVDSLEDPFGTVNGGLLTMKSKFLMFCASKIIHHIAPGFYDAEILVQNESIKAEINWDYDEDHGHPCIMFPIAVFNDVSDAYGEDEPLSFKMLQGLLLRGTGKLNGQYERAGKFTIYENDHIELLQALIEDKVGMEREAPWGSGITPTEVDYASMDVDVEGTSWYTITIV